MNFENFVTWENLASYGGCLAAVILLTQFVKNWLPKVNTQFTSYVLAVAILMCAHFFLGTMSAAAGVLTVINAAIISFAANGVYDAASPVLSKLIPQKGE